MPRSLFVLVGLACHLLIGLSPARPQDFLEDFETGTGGAFSYHQTPNDIKIERLQGRAASGHWYLRGVLPGQRKLEGLAVTATGLTGARLANVTAQVRGRGEVWLCLISGNGWLYSPATKPLTDQWQEISLSKVLIAADKSLGIYFITREVQPGAIFEVDRVQVKLSPVLPTGDAPVGPWRLEAEDFSPSARTVAADAEALGGKAIRSEQYSIAADMPVPQTSRPLHIACRVSPSAADDAWRLVTWQGGNIQYLQAVKPTRTNEWEWLQFKPALAGELGDRFGICSMRNAGAKGWLALDSVVIATQGDLNAEQLSASPELLGRRPLAAVGRGTAGSGIAIRGFVGVGSTLPATAQTTVQAAYDDANLYLHFECDEPLLDTAQQRRHEFLAKISRRDGEVHEDDSVVILLQPRGSNKTYDFTVNALGTIADAICVQPDLWGSRDVSWNSQATARGQIEERRWLADISIPWADLGGRPEAGDTWNACFGRIAKGRKETTSWNLSARGFHDPVAPGALVFVDRVPEIRLSPPATLKSQGNTIPPVSTSVEGLPPRVFTEIRSTSRVQHRYGYSFNVPDEADLTLAYGVLDAASLQPLALTPLLPQAVKSSSAELTLATPGPWELLLNGQRIAGSAQAPAQPIPVPLEKGMNVLALRLTKGTAALQGKLDKFTFDAANWRMAPAEVADPANPSLDDGEWPLAPKLGDHTTLGPMVGQADQPVVLRRTLLVEHTRVWPTPEPAYTLARGVTQHMTFRTEGLKGRKLHGWQTFIAVRPDFEVLGSTGFYGNNPGIPKWTTTQAGEQSVQGRKMRVVKIAADQPLVPGRHYIMSEFEAFVRAPESPPGAEASSGPPPEFSYWSQANDGSVIEAPQTIKVRVLPAVKGQRCKNLVWQLWGGWLSNMDDPGMREQVLACAQAAGFNDIVSGDRWTSDHAPRFGLNHTLGISFQPWALNLAPYLKTHPDQRLVAADGKPSDQYLCMTALLGEGWSAVRECLREKMEAVRPQTVDYDYEYGPFEGSPHACLCPRCLEAFRQYAKLPPAENLDGKIIAKRHRDAWVDFMARRVARMFGMFRRTIRELSPAARFSVYSGYATPDNAERYGVDWRYVGQEQGCDRAGCGYGRPAEAIRETIAALQGIPLICGALLTPYERGILTPVNPLTKAWLLRSVLDSTGGVLVYERKEMDGRSWLAVGETTRLVAAYEEVFLKGRRLALDPFSDAQVQSLQHGGTTLVCAMNPANEPRIVKVPLRPEWGAGQEFYGGRKVEAGSAVELTLEPGEAEVLVLRK
jgi:hypothetical protein